MAAIAHARREESWSPHRMAFGFGFNKQKVLSAAEKFVQQGKLQNAIAEYDKVLKHDVKDLTVNNTIGDLYARLGDSAKAIECFKKVGDAYAAQGFTVKGIAMYKKITKLQPSVDSSLKLAELYTQQGLFNDARAQYLQVAEDFMKNGDLDQAVRLFQKVLEMDPENVPMRVKLAEVYVRLEKKKEAWDIYSAVAESLRSRGSLPAAEDILKRMLALDPGNSYVLLLRGKSTLESGDPKGAIGYLEKASDLDSHPDGLRDLLKAYLQVGNLTKGAPLAEKLLTVHNDPEGLFLLAEGCARLGQYQEALDIYTRHADRLLATDSTKLLSSLHTMITRVRDDSGALDALLLLLNKAGESTHVNEVTELLAHASVEDGNLARARDLYQMLATTEPQNPVHMQNYQQVLGRLGGSSPATGITAEEGAVIIEELEATAPVIDQSYPDAIAIAVRSAVTDADLFLSYNLPDKAVVPLLAALPQAPSDARLNQRLAALHTRFQRFTEAAVCCRTLESVYHDAGYPDEATRYGELAARYEKSAAIAPLSPATSMAAASSPSVSAAGATAAAGSGIKAEPWPMAPSAAPEHHAAAPPEFEIHETMPQAAEAGEHRDLASDDLASEWENSLAVDVQAGDARAGEPVGAQLASSIPDEAKIHARQSAEIAETVEEIRFYLEHFMTEQAHAAMEKLETLTSDARILDSLRDAFTLANQPPEEREVQVAEINADEINADDIPNFDVAMEAQPEAGTVAHDLTTGYQQEPRTEIEEINQHLHDGAALHLSPDPPATWSDSSGAEATHAEQESELPSLVAELEAALGDSFPLAAPAAPSSGAQTVPGWPTTHEPAHSLEAKTHPLEAEPAGFQPVAHQPGAMNESETLAAATAMSSMGTSAKGTASAAAPALAVTANGVSTTAAPAVTFSAMSYSPAPLRPLGASAQAAHPSGGVDLSEMFGELKQELEEELIVGDDDPETHYSLGVAFREMGLLDEAIAEFQKVCTAIDRGKAFTQPVQTYTWLAQCFLDKGVPESAIHWYEKALNLPGLNEEGRLAINYELGSACESAQDRPGALRHFTDVYSANIDYRDVAERIQALKS
jgi:tetratricopeptide (TPR) repeat protein